MMRADPETVDVEQHGTAIRATATLPPLQQVDVLVSLFAASADDAPAFAAFLIGELVLTRMRFAASDPLSLFAFPRPSPAASSAS